MIQPPASLAARAHVGSMEEYRRRYERSLADPAGFWREQAESLDWFHPPLQIFDADPDEVDFSWFGGGRLNACYNCVDRHLATRGDKTGDHLGRRRARRVPHASPTASSSTRSAGSPTC